MNQYEWALEAGGKLTLENDRLKAQVERLTAENVALRDKLAEMVFVFDRDLRHGTVGRMTCDEARAILAQTAGSDRQ